MPDWLPEFRAAIDAEFAAGPRVAALATVDRDGRPRVRSVICRRVEPDGSLWLCSDARSAKNAQVRANPAAELVFWLPGRREQYRIAGTINVLSAAGADPRRAALWAEVSGATRALFVWPSRSGQTRPCDPTAFPTAVEASRPVPDTFELFVLVPEAVDHLAMGTHPHRRRRWTRQDGWREAEIDP